MTKENRGGARPVLPHHKTRGRKESSVRSLVEPASELGLDSNAPITASADIAGFGFCPHCKSVWWDTYSVTYWRTPEANEEPTGDYSRIIVAEEVRQRRDEWHDHKCPNRIKLG